MNHHIVPDFELDEDGAIPSSSGFYHQKYHKMPEDELVELLWQNGQVVMQNQTQRPLRKSVPPPPRFHLEDTSSLLHHVLPQKPAASSAADVGPSSVPEQQLYIQEDEMASWLQYPLEDTFDRDFCTDLLYPQASSSQTPAAAADRRAENKPTASSSSSKLPPIPPPRRVEHEADKTTNFALFSRLKGKAQAEHRPSVSENIGIASTVVDSSVTPAATAAPVSRVLPADCAAMASGGNVGSGSTCEREGGTCDPTVTSSSGGSGASADRSSKPPDSHSRKRKAREADEFEGLSEDAEFDFIEEKKASRRSSSARRTRAAEVHNLSERRRRDRINEKMKALQELIPHCNKSDKASMLDEAIEYLKSLQLQVQMMSMGCGMGPMVFPGVQHYMSPMGMGMGMGVGMGMGIGMDMSSGSLNRPMLPFPPVLPPTPMHGAATHLGPRLPIPPFCMPHIPLSDQSRVQVTGQTDPVFNMVGLQIPNAQQPMNLADPYQHFLNFHHMAMPPLSQTAAPPPSGSKGTEALDSKKSG